MDNYNSLNAKVKAMKSRLLDYDDYYYLSNLKNVLNVAVKLRSYPEYERYLSNIDEIDLRRNNIERKITISLYENYIKLYNFINDFSTRKFINDLFLKNQIHTIKLLLCILYDERNVIYSLPEFLKTAFKNYKINVNSLVNAKSIDEFIQCLRNTEFYFPLSKFYNSNPTLFELEFELDIFYYMNLKKSIKKYLNKKDKLVMDKIIGSEIDLRNILWIHRLKKYYNYEKDQIYSKIIPIRHRLNKQNINDMIEAKTEQRFFDELEKTCYYDVFKENIEEKKFIQTMTQIYKKEKLKYPNSIAVVSEYIHLKEVEINNITTLIEGVRYSIKDDEIMTFLSIFKTRTEVI